MRAPAYARPGQPEGPWWHVLAFLGALFGASAVGWALLAGVVWLVWAYTLVAGSLVVGLALTVLIARLALKRDRRSTATAVVLFIALDALVLWVVSR